MQALNRLIETIRLQLRGLTLNAKMLIGSLMVILVMSLFLVSLYAGRRSMAPLNLPSDLGPEIKAQAVNFLKTREIPYQERGGDIFVPSDQRTIVLAQLVDYQLLTADQVNFEKLIADDSPFRSRAQNDQRYLIAKMNELSTMIRQFRGIYSAKVMIDPASSSKGLGSSHIPPSASVSVSTNGRGLTQEQADTIANLVAGAQAGLKVENVNVTDASTGQVFEPRGEAVRSTMKNLEAKLAAEKHTRDSLFDALSYIPGVRVNVNATVDTREVVQQTTNYEDPKLGVTGEETKNFISTRQPMAADPGVRPNTGANLASAGRTSDSITDERSKIESIPFTGHTTQRIHDSKGQALVINAAIGVPRSYFITVFKTEQGDDTVEPDTAALEQIVQTETEKIKNYIQPLIDTRAVDGAIAGVLTVTMFHDIALGGFGPGGAGGVMENDGLGGFGVDEGLMKYVGLSGLALISLAMMFLMVRKATTHEELPSPEELVGIPPALADTESDLIGEAEESSAALEGLEIDQDQIKRQEMLEQIRQMVQESPDEAAHLMRKWIQESNH